METTGKLHPDQKFIPERFKQLDGADFIFGASASGRPCSSFAGSIARSVKRI